MRTSGIIAVCLMFIGLSGCATLPQRPINEQSAAIGISLYIRAPIKISGSTPGTVFFVRLVENDNPYTKLQLIPSNYIRGGIIYLLNAEPGRYAAVASSASLSQHNPGSSQTIYKRGDLTVSTSKQNSSSRTVYFPKDMIDLTEVTVAPGTMAFMGDYIVDESTGFSEADEAQLHYREILHPGSESKLRSFARFISQDFIFRGSLHQTDKSSEARDTFQDKTIKNFNGSG